MNIEKTQQANIIISQENSGHASHNCDTSYTGTIPHVQAQNGAISVQHLCVLYSESMSTEKRLEAVGLKIIHKNLKGYRMNFVVLGGVA